MARYRRTSARTAVAQAISPHFPADWAIVEHEGRTDDHEQVQVRISTRRIGKSDTGYAAAHLVTTRVTITWPGSLQDAEEAADNDMEAFLFALDAAGVDWSECVKAQYSDENNRLGYSVDVESRTEPSEED